jgi:hypothetical protein
LESAALLHEVGAEVEVIAKIPQLRWIGMHPRLHQLGPISAVLYSSHDVGPAGISRLVAMPNVMKRVPLRLRDRIRTRAVRRAGAKWLPERLRKVRVAAGRTVIEAREFGDQVRMKLDDGTERSVHHVLMGTGYSVDIAKYDFIARDLLDRIKVLDGYLVLTSGLCSTVPGLHFVGATAARTFGPLLYVRSGHGIRVERSYFLHQAIREPNTMNVCRRRLRRCWHDEEGVFELDIGQSMPP